MAGYCNWLQAGEKQIHVGEPVSDKHARVSY